MGETKEIFMHQRELFNRQFNDENQYIENDFQENEIAPNWMIEKITLLINSCCLSGYEIMNIENEICSTGVTINRCKEIMNYLNNNQIDPIEQGKGYSQTDIHNKLDDIMKDERK